VRIYVGGLPYSTDSEGLRVLFAEQGEVSDATVVVDRSTGQSKGFGFVEMPNDFEAQSAIQKLNGKNMDGRNLTMNEVRPREESGGGEGGLRGGGSRW
jgi:cold-inducible RNA-binding protein